MLINNEAVSITRLLKRFKDHQDEEAANELCATYFSHLHAVAKSKVFDSSGGDVDTYGAVAEALAYYFAQHRQKLESVHDRDDLMRVLASKTIDKAIDMLRKATAQKRTPPNGIQSMDAIPGDMLESAIRDVQPDVLVMLREELVSLIEKLDEPHATFVNLLADGSNLLEIADRLGLTEQEATRQCSQALRAAEKIRR